YEDVRRRLSKLHAMIHEIELMDHRLYVVDTMACLRDAVRREDDKLVPLLQLVDQVGLGIREKEAHTFTKEVEDSLMILMSVDMSCNKLDNHDDSG
ncbi:hypothetical protein Tco_1142327, partial [Tanacetum coccineum]